MGATSNGRAGMEAGKKQPANAGAFSLAQNRPPVNPPRQGERRGGWVGRGRQGAAPAKPASNSGEVAPRSG